MAHAAEHQRDRRFFWMLGIQGGLVMLLLGCAAFMNISISRVRAQDDATLASRLAVNNLNLDLLALQGALGGYVGSGETAFLDSYRAAEKLVDADLAALANDAATSEQAVALKADFGAWRDEYGAREVAAIQAGDRAGADQLIRAGRPAFDAIVTQVAETRLGMRGEAQILRDRIDLINWIQLGTVVLLSGIILASTLVLLRFWRREHTLWAELQTTSQDLAASNAELKASTSEQLRINARLQSRIDESRLINALNDALANEQEPALVYATVARQVGEYLGGWCSIALRQPPPNDDLLYITGLYYPDPSLLQAIADWLNGLEIPVNQGLHAPLFTNQDAVVMLQVPQEIRRPPDLPPELEDIADLINLTSYIGVPITVQGAPIGVISVSSSTDNKFFDAEHELFLTQIADRLASWIENSRLFHLAEQRAAELQASFDSITDIIAIYDSAGRQVRINKTGRLFLGDGSVDTAGPETIWRRPNGAAIDPSDHPVAQALVGEGVSDIELALLNASNQPIVHTVSAAPLRSTDGRIGGAVLVARDITARKELERLKEELVANMSHELRTPLTAILGYSELLLKRRTDALTPWHTSKIEGIQAGGQRLLALVNDLLDIAKLDAGHVELKRAPVNINRLIQSQATILQPMMTDKNQTLELTLADGLPPALVDQDRIGQVLTNLLSNAIKFTPDGGRICISSAAVTIREGAPPAWRGPEQAGLPAVKDGAYIAVSVRDTGVGVAPGALPHLWDRFYQAEGGTARRFGGTGLGLSIVQQLLDLHGGAAWASSPGEDQGSTFAFLVPAGAADSAPVQAAPASDGVVLVIEHDQTTAAKLEGHLGQAGFATKVAASADEALAWAVANQPAAITLDLLVPGSRGWETLAALRRMPHLADTPIVLAGAEPTRGGQALGASTYLVKPIEGEVLVQIIQQLTGNATRTSSHILIVEDDFDMASLVSATLQEHGYTTRMASDGSVALDLLRSDELPGLILLDLMMPIVDGFELLARLRDDARTCNIPVIVVTARDLANDEIKQLRRAAQGIQTKHTLTMDTLVAEVERHIGTKE